MSYTGLIIYVGLIALSLLGWLVCEAIGKLSYTHSEAEEEGWKEMAEHAAEHGNREMTIRDILRTNSTKGFDAV